MQNSCWHPTLSLCFRTLLPWLFHIKQKEIKERDSWVKLDVGFAVCLQTMSIAWNGLKLNRSALSSPFLLSTFQRNLAMLMRISPFCNFLPLLSTFSTHG